MWLPSLCSARLVVFAVIFTLSICHSQGEISIFKAYILRGWIKVLCTSAICCKADQGEGNTHITQDVVSRAIRVLPGHSCAMSFAIVAMSKAMSMYVRTNLDACLNVFGCVD